MTGQLLIQTGGRYRPEDIAINVVASIETWKEEPRLTYRWAYEYGNGYGVVSKRMGM